MAFEEVRIGDWCRLIRGDCLEVLPTLGEVDCVVTDPPYGIGYDYATHDDSESGWFRLMDSVIPTLKAMARFVVMPSCKMSRLGWWYANHDPTWLIAWYKGSPGHNATIGFNDWEPLLTWGRPPVAMHDHFQTKCGFDDNGHPCPKPIEWARWLCERAAIAGGTILDPFMGSCSTGVACWRTGRKFIGIEIDPTYFEIAVKRIRAEVAQGRLFEPEPGPTEAQASLLDEGTDA